MRLEFAKDAKCEAKEFFLQKTAPVDLFRSLKLMISEDQNIRQTLVIFV